MSWYPKVMVGRLQYKTNEEARHRELKQVLNSLVERARDSTMLDVGVDVGKIEDLFKLEQVSVQLPPNDWREDNRRGNNHDRWFCLRRYINKAKVYLETQGFKVEVGKK